MINLRWARWITASVNEYLNDSLKASLGDNVVFNLEGEVAPDQRKHQVWIEGRMDGPFYRPISAGRWYLWVEINLLVSASINEESVYVYRDYAAACAKALSGSIDLYKFGDDIEDDGSQIGCLLLGEIYQNHLGKIHPTTLLQQATIETRAFVELDE